MKSYKSLGANFAVFLVALIWGSTFVVIKDSLVDIHAITLVCYRFVVASIAMGRVLIFLKKNPWVHLKEGLILGVLLFIAQTLQVVALYYMMVVDAGFILGLFIIFVPLLSFMMGREKLSGSVVFAIILAGVGLWIITGGVKEFRLGHVLMLLGALVFALHMIYVDKVVKRCDVWVLNFQQFVVSAVAAFCGVLLFRLPLGIANWQVASAILYLALFANVLSYILQLWAQKAVSPTTCALVLSLEPVFTAVFAWTIGGEKIIISDIIGGVVIITAIILAEVCRHNKSKRVLP